MSVAGRELSKPGNFKTHRAIAGAAAADSANYTTFALADAFFGYGCQSILVCWTATGGAQADTIDIEPLIRDAVNDRWIALPKKTVRMNQAVEFDVFEAGQIFLRIDAEATTGTDVNIRVAKGRPADVA